ncbi:MAG: DUF3179 domain-containing protein [Planctomycetota bacterium]
MKKPRTPFLVFAAFGLVVTGVVGLRGQLWQEGQGIDEAPLPAAPTIEEISKAEAADFTVLLGNEDEEIGYALMRINNRWHDATAVMLLETLRFAPNAATARGSLELLRRRLEVDFGTDLDAWYRHVWSLPEPKYEGYAAFKADFYGALVDESFQDFFAADRNTLIRLDEIRWGGVRRNGIPPLDRPAMLSADEANYLAETDIIFGITGGGRAKAYPKRILAWHEMVKDSIAGEPITGVYCTLCGAVIMYKSKAGDLEFDFGTSGFLYRSNKLMFDQATNSLWSSLKGEPVVGPLAGNGLKLETLPVVTTTWGKWKSEHPKTLVLSLDTGYQRDYGEGVAYRDYFASDELMFTVPRQDERLRAKDEVFIVRGSDAAVPLAISVEFLQANRVFHSRLGERSFVVMTDDAGGSRAYECGEFRFLRSADGGIVDGDGRQWQADENGLRCVDEDQIPPCNRIPSHRAFWFAWFSQFPDTKLVALDQGDGENASQR